MSLVKAKGNMYPFVSHTWNPIKGRCLHDCPYCYVKSSRAKRYYQGDPCLSEKELKVNLGKNNYIFVGSMTDMWGDWIPSEWIAKILMHCAKYPENKYLFQSKNPERFMSFNDCLPIKIVLGTTCEFDSHDSYHRIEGLTIIKGSFIPDYLTDIQIMISIEPIMQIEDVDMFASWIKWANPSFVVIGADSKGHNLPEPPTEKIKELITELRKFTKVICKKNLDRLLKEK